MPVMPALQRAVARALDVENGVVCIADLSADLFGALNENALPPKLDGDASKQRLQTFAVAEVGARSSYNIVQWPLSPPHLPPPSSHPIPYLGSTRILHTPGYEIQFGHRTVQNNVKYKQPSPTRVGSEGRVAAASEWVSEEPTPTQVNPAIRPK